ncbi:hypothetical protein BGZ75_005836 [Mortierella antarctica]|nr:hypothetical protein BGZ75_005836 [Mortierella antarctica]
MATHQSPANAANGSDLQLAAPLDDPQSPILPPSDPDFDSNEEQQPPTPTPPPTGALPVALVPHAQEPPPMAQPANRTLHVPAPLRRNNSSSFSAFSEIPSLPAFLNNCNLSQYLQSFNDAGAADDALPLMIDFDDDELRSIMEAIPMKPFHAVTFRKGIRELRERSRLGSMHFDNSQTSFMQVEPHSTLHYSHSQFFQQHSQHSQPSLSQNSYPSQTSINSSQPARGVSFHYQGNNAQPPSLYRQPSKSSAQPTSQSQMPTPSQLLQSGSVYQYVGPAPRSMMSNQPAQPVPLFSEDQPNLQRSNSKNEPSRAVKRRRSSSETPLDAALAGTSPVLPEPSSFYSNSSSSWTGTPNTLPGSQQDQATREMIMHQALIYGKHSSRSLTKYEDAINRAAQTLALEEPGLLANKGQLWNRAKAKLLEEDYDYKRGRSRSKLPEASKKRDVKQSKTALMQKREANASHAATARIRRISSLGEQMHRKTAEREALLAQLLRLESPEYKQARPHTYEGEAQQARDRLGEVETERSSISKELASLKNKERKHQWYEKRKKNQQHNENGETPSEQDDRAAEADVDAETDTTVDPEGDASQRSLSGKPQAAAAMAALQQAAQQTPVPASTSTAASAATKSTSSKAPKLEPARIAVPTSATTRLVTPIVASMAPADASMRTTTTTATMTSTVASADAKAPTPRTRKRKDIFRTSEYSPGLKS